MLKICPMVFVMMVALPEYNYIKHVKYSRLYDGATLWNTLDKNIVHAQSLIDFKKMFMYGM